MSAPSGAGISDPRAKHRPVNYGRPSTNQPLRLPRDTNSPVARISSNPLSRSASQSSTFSSNAIQVGQPVDTSNSTARMVAFTVDNQTNAGASQLTAAEQARNLEAVNARKSGVLGCIGKSPSNPNPGCATPCDTIDCLEKMLVGNLLDLDAKKLLCDAVTATERAIKRDVDSAGDQLLGAAKALTDISVINAPLRVVNNFIGKIDPGQVANCLGAQAVKDNIQGKLRKAQNTVKKFQKGYQDKIAKKFNDGTAALQQFSLAPDQCNRPKPASLSGILV
jgi:hypothetical protein